MLTAMSRRSCIRGGAAAMAGVAITPLARGAAPSQPSGSGGLTVSTVFPSQDRELVRTIVGSSHRDLDRVRGLLKDSPRLANCAYDWGFGDWETPLGAASHTGRIEIARLLLEHDARPDTFALAMLGDVDAVAAMLKAQPALARARGPHGLTLMHHAKAGGDAAQAVVALLEKVEGADIPYPVASLPDPGVYEGTFRIGPGEEETVEIAIDKNQSLTFRRTGGNSIRLFHLGDHRFHPAGASDTIIAFGVEAGRATRLSITTPAPLIEATRV